MLQSKLFGKTIKETPRDVEVISHKLLLRGGFIHQVFAGIYSYLPLGFRVLKKIDQIIREELAKKGVQDMVMPVVHPASLWQKTGRWDEMDDVLIKFKNKKGQKFLIAPTHEEVVTQIAKSVIKSYKDLPMIVNQNQIKFRDETRAYGGLIRLREFTMQDAYSFDKDEKGLDENFIKIKDVYSNIFKRCGLKTIAVQADPGAMGGKGSQEFMVLALSGEDKIYICQKCRYAVNSEIVNKKKMCPKCRTKLKVENCIELGHVFKLGTKYSKAFNLNFTDQNNKERLVVMGCYGIGLDRLMACAVEQNHDQGGIIWPKELSPFQVHLIEVKNLEPKVKSQSEKLYYNLQKAGIDVLYDDRDESPGVKLKDADLIGIPIRLVVSKRTLSEHSVEMKMRNEKKIRLIKLDKVIPEILKIL